MKNFLKLFVVCLIGFSFFFSCEDTEKKKNDDDTKKKLEELRAENKKLYNQYLLGEWEESDYKDEYINHINTSTIFKVENGNKLIFKENEAVLVEGHWNSNTYSKTPKTFPINDFATLIEVCNYENFSYSNVYPKRYVAYSGSNVNYTFYYVLRFDVDNENYIEYYASYGSVPFIGNGTYVLFFETKALKNGNQTFSATTYNDEHWKLYKKTNNTGNGSTADIPGTYKFASNSYTHTFVFNQNGTFQFTNGSGVTGQNLSGTWSINGSKLTMNATLSGGSIEEYFTVSANGSSYSLNYDGSSKGQGGISSIFSQFGVYNAQFTITKQP